MPGVAWPHWRDTQVRIHGEAAQALQVAFFTAWNNTKAEQIDDKTPYFPDLSEEVPELLPVQITMSGPDSQWHGIRQLYFHLIVSARDHVYIQSPFFIPDETISEAMKSAALGGVDVRMICTPRGATFQIPYRAANTYFQEMAEAGVKIYLYNGGYYHAKTVNMDSQICSIGSCNMDIRSYNLNYEINSVLYDRDQAEELAAQFMRDLEDCTEFDLGGIQQPQRLVALHRFDLPARFAGDVNDWVGMFIVAIGQGLIMGLLDWFADIPYLVPGTFEGFNFLVRLRVLLLVIPSQQEDLQVN